MHWKSKVDVLYTCANILHAVYRRKEWAFEQHALTGDHRDRRRYDETVQIYRDAQKRADTVSLNSSWAEILELEAYLLKALYRVDSMD